MPVDEDGELEPVPEGMNLEVEMGPTAELLLYTPVVEAIDALEPVPVRVKVGLDVDRGPVDTGPTAEELL